MMHPAKFRVVRLATWILLASLPAPALAQSSLPTLDPALPPPSTAPAPVPAPTADYVLGVGDQIEITVFAYEEFTGAKAVLPDGNIILPMIGRVPAVGRTAAQLEQDLTNRLQVLLVNPVVSVNLLALRPVVVNVAGEVQRPGSIQFSGTANSSEAAASAQAQQPTLANALMAAGGITSNADIRQITVRRYDPNGTTEPIIINLWDAIHSDQALPLPLMHDGDSIYIPRLPADAEIDRRLIARSQFAPATVRVRVVGEVTRPGEVTVPPDSSISSAVAIAGGPTENADLSEVNFIRLSPTGQIEQQEIDLRNLTATNQIQDGDVVIVPERNSSSIIDLANRIVPPLGLLLNLILP